MNHKLVIRGLLLFLSINIYAAPFVLTENSLLTLAEKTNSPGLRQADLELYNAKSMKAQALDNLAPNLYSFAKTGTTRENALIQFIPVFTPTRTFGVGIKKNLSVGMSYDLSISGDQRSAQSLNLEDASTSKINLDLKIDLWNDFLGSRTKSIMDIGDLSEKKSQLKNDLDKKKFKLTIRRLYWQLVAISESIQITDRIYKLAELQVKEIKKRYRNSVADKATVALFSSQLVARSAQRNQLKYNYEMTMLQLKNLLPALNEKEIKFGKYDTNATVNKVLQCSSVINSFPEAPKKYTSVDEMVALLKDIQQKELKVNSKHSNMDVYLQANLRNTGINSSQTETGSLSAAIDDFRDNDRKGYDVGVYVNIPFGGQKKSTEEIKNQLINDRYISLIESLSANLESTHIQIRNTIQLLIGLIKDQKENNKQLNIRLDEMNKKYKQARIDYTEFITDQNNALSSDLAVLQTELMILNTIFDYLEVFSDTPCSLNI